MEKTISVEIYGNMETIQIIDITLVSSVDSSYEFYDLKNHCRIYLNYGEYVAVKMNE